VYASLISLICRLLFSTTTKRFVYFKSLFLRVYCLAFCSASLQNSYNNIDVQFVCSSLLIKLSSNALIRYISVLMQ
jgi:hypothetical protein